MTDEYNTNRDPGDETKPLNRALTVHDLIEATVLACEAAEGFEVGKNDWTLDYAAIEQAAGELGSKRLRAAAAKRSGADAEKERR